MTGEKSIFNLKKDCLLVMLRSQFLQRFLELRNVKCKMVVKAFSLIQALKKNISKSEDSKAALKRHLECFNTHPYIASTNFRG